MPSESKERRTWPAREIVLTSALGAVLLSVVIGNLVASERFVYYWDFAGYWVSTIELGALLDDPAAATTAFVDSVRHQKYNLLPALPLAPLARWTEGDRTAWTLGILFVYGLPALVAMTAMTWRLRTLPWQGWSATAAVATFVLFPSLWAPIARGAVGIGGVALAATVWLGCVFPLRAMPWRRALGLGVLLALLILFRRWYGFWAASFVGALCLEAVIESPNLRDRLHGLKRALTPGAAAGVVLLALATPVAITMLTNDPAATRAAYRSTQAYLDGIVRFLQHFGALPLAMALAGLILTWSRDHSRPLARVLVVQLAIILLLFLRVQRFDRHHYYLVAPQIAIMASVFVVHMASRARGSLRGRFAVASSLVILALGFAASFSDAVADRITDRWSLWPAGRHRPYVRQDLPEIVRLTHTLDALLDEPDDSVYVLSSYRLLNEDILKNAHYTTSASDLSGHVLRSAHIDRKEGSPYRLFDADYVVVTDPPRVHLQPSEQEVILLPARAILSGTGIGRSFRKLPASFTLEDGTSAHLYERIRPIPASAQRALGVEIARDALRRTPPN